MNHGKHTTLGLGILIGGLATALFLRQAPSDNDSLPELEQTKVLERDFSLDFGEEPIVATAIDEFESLHPLDFEDRESLSSRTRLPEIEVAATPKRERAMTQPFSGSAQTNRPRSPSNVEEAIPRESLLPAGSSVPARTINAKESETAGFQLPDNMFTESFLREDSEPDDPKFDLKVTTPQSPRGSPSPPSSPLDSEEKKQSVEQPERTNPAARVIVPRRVRLGEPLAGQVETGTRDFPKEIAPRSVEGNSAATETPTGNSRTRFSSSEKRRDRSFPGQAHDSDPFPSLEGLEPFSISGRNE